MKWFLAYGVFLAGISFGQKHHTEDFKTFVHGATMGWLIAMVITWVVREIYDRQQEEERWKNRLESFASPATAKPSSPGTGMGTTCAALAAATGTPATAPETPETSASSGSARVEPCGIPSCHICYPREAA